MGFPKECDRCEHGEYLDRECKDCEILFLRSQRDSAMAELELLRRKAAHGCHDALCPECDGD